MNRYVPIGSIAALAVVVVALMALRPNGDGQAGPDSVRVPDVTFLTVSHARDSVSNAGLSPKIVAVPPDFAAKPSGKDSVSNQTPAPNAEVPAGSTVELEVLVPIPRR